MSPYSRPGKKPQGWEKAKNREIATPFHNPNRVIWCRLEHAEIVVYAGDLERSKEIGPDYNVSFFISNRRPFHLRVSVWTEEEVEAFAKVMEVLIDRARATAKLRDKHAQKVYDEGGPAFERLYRRPPILVDRSREVPQYDESVYYGPQDDLGLVGPSDTAPGIGESSTNLAEFYSSGSEPEDDGEEADES